MPRDAHIPLVLWISTATLVHAMGGSGAIEVAKTLSDRASMRAMVSEIRQDLLAGDGTIEVITDATQLTPRSEPNPAENPSAKPVDPPPEPPKPEEKKPPPKKPPPRPLVLKQKPKPPDPPKPKPPDPPKKAEEKKKPPPPPLLPLKDPPKKEQAKPKPPDPPIAKKEEPKVKPPDPPPPQDRRTAVVQDVAKDQPDNPNARNIADQANTVKEETVARARAYDGTPTAKTDGGRAGTAAEKGNAEEDQVGHNEEKTGDPDHAPGESKAAAVASVHSNPVPPAPPSPASPAAKPGPPMSVPGNTGGGGRTVSLTPPTTAPPAAASPGGAGPASPDVGAGPNGSWSLDPANPGGDGSSKVAGPKREAVVQNPVRVQSMGFGAPGLPGGININLSMAGLEAAVGQDKLKQERAADGAARRAKHRGANGEKESFDWRAAVENYQPGVKVGNQTSLNAAKSAFASYLNTMHNRIHPIFADQFLQSLSNLPPGHKLNENLVTHVEIVLSKDDGRIVRAGITRSSGSTVFDLVSVSSSRSAGPFGKPPDAIVSPDGKVYIHWEFHRDPYDACSSRNARPYLLKAAEEKKDDKAEPTPKPPPPPKPPEERKDPPSTTGPVPLPRE
ncbi:MAG: hypothetical protein R3B70_29075 [Polyangiaceae bacterium]